MHAINRQSAPWDGTVLRAMEWGTLVFVLLMFAGRFGTVRELALYVPALLLISRALLLHTPGFAWRTPLFAVLVLFVVSGILSSFQSSDVTSSLAALKKDHLKLLILYAVIATAFSREGPFIRLGLAFSLAGLAYLAVGGYRIAGDLASKGQIDYLEVRYFATVYLYFLPALFVQVLAPGNRFRPLWATGCVGMLSAIVLIGVRGVWVSLAGAALLWAFAVRHHLRTLLRPRLLAISLSLAALVVLLAFILFPSQFLLLRGHTFEKLQMSLRLETWETFVSLSLQRPLLGHGLDDQAMSRHYHETFTREKGAAPTEINPTTPHNQFVKIFYTQGFVGLVLYIALLILALRALYRAFRRGPPGAASLFPLAAASVVLAEYVLHCLFEDRSLTPLAVLIGVAGACLPDRQK